MKILSCNTYHIALNFKQSPQNTVDIGKLTGTIDCVDKFVNQKFEEQKEQKQTSLSSKIYDGFVKFYNDKINEIEKFNKPYKKALILSNLAHSYYENKDVTKAAVILAQSLNTIDKNEKYRQNDIKKIIEDKENINIFRDFFYSSNNLKAKYFVMKSLNALNAPFYLPIAETVCDCDDKTTSNDKRTLLEAKKFINKNYNLDKIANYLDKNINYKIGALNLLNKWGLENHKLHVQKLINDDDDFVNNKAKSVYSRLSHINDIDNNSVFEYEIDRPISAEQNIHNRNELIKLINTSQDDKSLVKYIKEFGNIGYLNIDAELVKPKEDETYSKLECEKAEAFLKIVLRGNIKNSKLNKITSFKGHKVNKASFNILDQSDNKIEELSEIFYEASDNDIKEACKIRYGNKFIDAFATDGEEKYNKAYEKFMPFIEKTRQKANKIEKDISSLIELAAKGESNIYEKQEYITKTFFELLKIEQAGKKIPKNNGILIYGDAPDSDKVEFVNWFKKNVPACIEEYTYDETKPFESIKEMVNIAKNAKETFNKTGKRTILELKNMDILLTNDDCIENRRIIAHFKQFAEHCSERYQTTLLMKTNFPLEEFEPASIGSQRFEKLIMLKDGIKPKQKDKLNNLKKEKERLIDSAKKINDYYWWVPDPGDEPLSDWARWQIMCGEPGTEHLGHLL